MLSPDKLVLLRGFLGTLPEHLAMRLAYAVEIDRLMDGTILPHDVILDGLRPVLRRAPQRRRMPTPLRYFCRPIEDLLSTAPRRHKQKARIARTSIVPVWSWIGQVLLPAETRAFSERMTVLIVEDRRDQAKQCAAAFWALASSAMRSALASEADRRKARAILSDEFTLADAEEMALLLSVAPAILDLQDKVTRQTPSFSDELLWSVRAVYDRLAEAMPDAAPYVAVIAMNRLARPWEALRLPLMVARQSHDTLISLTDMGLAGELLFGDLDALASAVRGVRHPNFDAQVVIENLASFSELSSAVVKEIDIRRDGKWGQGLLKDRSAVSGAMIALMERAPKEIASALPMRKVGSFGTTRLPDVSRSVDGDRIACALRYARLIVGCRPFAAAASFAAKQKDAHDQATQYLERYNDELLKELRAAEGARKAIVEDQFGVAVELTAILFSEEEAELLRRRGKAAVSAAA